MIGLEVRFLAGRFHANAWHQAHNEGIAEWPPSPWRILRALISAAYAEDLPVPEVEALVEKLRTLPRYRLPLAVDAHTRHYMPNTDDANHERAKVFDAFVAIEGGARDPQPMTIAWDVTLSEVERVLLARLARRVTYLGRAESWSDVRVVDVCDNDWDCWPDETARHDGATILLAPSSAAVLADWSRDRPRPKKGPDVPRTLWDVLTFEAARLENEGWSDVPGTLRARYVFRRPPFQRSALPRVTAAARELPTVARYAIRSAVLPLFVEAIAIAERVRTAAMSQSRRISGDAHPVFSGHGEVAAMHRHAMYLSESSDKFRIDHIVVSAVDGFTPDDVRALQAIRRVWGRDGHDLELVLTNLGVVREIGGTGAYRCRLLAESRTWRSVTPFVATRHPKVVRGVLVEGIEHQIRRACEQVHGLSPVEVSPFGDRAAWSRFRRRRLRGGGRHGPDAAYGAELVFS
jgi:CRISPR-associated protein Csb2